MIATLNDTREQAAFDARIGAPFPVPSFTISSGLDAANEPVDEDADGNPGVTLPTNIGGLRALDAYVGLNMMTTYTATLSAADAISGTISFSVSGQVFGSNNPVLSSGNIDVVPASTSVPLTAQRLEGDVPCSAVLPMFP